MEESLKLKPNTPALCVDLDGTLVKTDLLVEATFQLIKDEPLAIFRLPFWLLRGKAVLKHEIFTRVDLDVVHLPYNKDVLAFIQKEYDDGRQVVLATASHRKIADQVADHLGKFSAVVASDWHRNLVGRRKAEALVQMFGRRNFAYIGNAAIDLEIWKEACEAYVVNPNIGLTRRIRKVTKLKSIYRNKRSVLKTVMKAVRVHQWAKNLLIFVPLFLSHRFGELPLLLTAIMAFLTFTLVSSSVYLLNDLLDLESDRLHPDKMKRPFAAGDLPLMAGLMMAPFLLVAGFVLAGMVSLNFLWVMLGYFVVTSAYSFHLKQVVLADVIILAMLYALRVFAGSVAVDVALSSWFLAFAGFFFFSLALVKRCSELVLSEKIKKKVNPRRGYWISDLSQMVSFGTSSGYISVLVFALYLNSEQVTEAYAKPEVLWFMLPVLLYWISRMWLKAHRGMMHSDPLVFAMKDRVSYIMIGAMVIIWAIASGGF